MPDIDDYHDGGCLDWLFGELRVQEQQLGVYKSLDLLEDFIKTSDIYSMKRKYL